mmetsp:Transcript_32979/g.94722  ORF Transcript_32979/g.94722 Transcript_32979/m.94722 type:complete len:292 (-) Transcript_32979:499-1374(-)
MQDLEQVLRWRQPVVDVHGEGREHPAPRAAGDRACGRPHLRQRCHRGDDRQRRGAGRRRLRHDVGRLAAHGRPGAAHQRPLPGHLGPRLAEELREPPAAAARRKHLEARPSLGAWSLQRRRGVPFRQFPGGRGRPSLLDLLQRRRAGRRPALGRARGGVQAWLRGPGALGRRLPWCLCRRQRDVPPVCVLRPRRQARQSAHPMRRYPGLGHHRHHGAHRASQGALRSHLRRLAAVHRRGAGAAQAAEVRSDASVAGELRGVGRGGGLLGDADADIPRRRSLGAHAGAEVAA